MIYSIKKGQHYASPRHQGLVGCKKRFKYLARFTASCKYDHEGTYDDQDINKLFGVGYLPSHHQHSARFGWFYDNENEKVVIAAYFYVKGQRFIDHMYSIPVEKEVTLELIVDSKFYKLNVYDDGTLVASRTSARSGGCIGYLLGGYFGGNNPAPHDVYYHMTPV